MKGQKLPEDEKVARARKLPKIIVTENGETVGLLTEHEKSKRKGRTAVDKSKGPPEPEWEAIDRELEAHEVEDRIAVWHSRRSSGLVSDIL
jgi:hypothetical protein